MDFNYEVSRALAAGDGAILVVDAAQGIEAQTLANVYLALDHNLDVFPVINKIDLPSAEPQRVIEEIEDVIGIEAQDAPPISAKNGIGIEEVLEQIVHRIPAPKGDTKAPLQALIFDSLYDSYKGVIDSLPDHGGHCKKGHHDTYDGYRSQGRSGRGRIFWRGSVYPLRGADGRNGRLYHGLY